MKKNTFIILLCFFTITTIHSQNHYFGFSAGYTTSSATIPNNNLSFNTSNGLITRGNDFFDFTGGLQIGLQASIDIGNDLVHLDLSPIYSQYGFESEQQKIKLDYFDFDIGGSNFNSVGSHKLVYGGGLTPSLLISSKNIEDVNNFDLKLYAKIGYKFTDDLIIYSQLRLSFLELVPDTKVKNLQVSFNLSYNLFNI